MRLRVGKIETGFFEVRFYEERRIVESCADEVADCKYKSLPSDANTLLFSSG